eukprot:CAMPEP_0117658360 /NCGR_PEP_ID=MMETSP0804-20121206/5824_1 /TAXON_ID=1074897 /ORGANISM="Tetraselmis astigmatica, Strain CCMP880" /LENGTH=511 /DNA_ID=CAMNT_0005464879 /DNA_START=90 /DNA_END=1622 /DNA_ORIENTATION=+
MPLPRGPHPCQVLLLTVLSSTVLAIAARDRYLHLYGTSDRQQPLQQRYGFASQLGRTPEALADRVSYLPGWGEPHFEMYSGYITVDEAAGRSLFYAMAEASINPSAAPVFLWLNGGPGCSSLGGGFLSELGPYFPRREKGKLKSNPYSWHRNATVIFLESPAFVGFSYSNTSSDKVVGDERTAVDTYKFLLALMQRFPELADRPLWLSGESYGGHYVPSLAATVVEGNEAGINPKLPLKGFLVGNPWTDATLDNRGAVDFWYGHAIISTDTAEGMKAHCDFSTIGPLKVQSGAQMSEERALDQLKCDMFVDRAFVEMGNINIYDIFADVCVAEEQRVMQQMAKALLGLPASTSLRHALKDFPTNEGDYDPCVDDEVAEYFNDPEVQASIHANVSGMLPYPWADCADGRLQYSRADLLSSMVPTYEKLLGKGLQMLVYSGDIDAIVPVTGTRKWVEGLGLEVISHYRPWISSIDGQVAGWTKTFTNGLTFATVRGAGHMVPYTQPARAFDMV